MTIINNSQINKSTNSKFSGFTIVELLIVIVVIAILAAISVVAYRGIQDRAKEATIQSNIRQAKTAIELTMVENGSYPSALSETSFRDPGDGSIAYTSDGSSYCVSIKKDMVAFRTSNNTQIEKGKCFTGVVTTVAGDGTAGFVDGAGAGARFRYPKDIAVDGTGNLFITDADNSRIRKITPSGTVTTIAGDGTYAYADGTGTSAKFYAPWYLAIDSVNSLFVADTFNNRIRKITPGGAVTTIAGDGTYGYADGTGTSAKFHYPVGIVADNTSNLFVADSANNRIRKITPSGVVSTIAGSGTAGYADGVGANAKFYGLEDIAIDSTGNLFVADSKNNRIRKITPGGVVSTVAGSTAGYADGTVASAKFNRPWGIAVDSADNLFVADTFNHRIRKITPGGIVTTVAGSTAGYADDAGVNAKFDLPSSVAVDSIGRIFVVDYNNHLIRKIE